MGRNTLKQDYPYSRGREFKQTIHRLLDNLDSGAQAMNMVTAQQRETTPPFYQHTFGQRAVQRQIKKPQAAAGANHLDSTVKNDATADLDFLIKDDVVQAQYNLLNIIENKLPLCEGGASVPPRFPQGSHICTCVEYYVGGGEANPCKGKKKKYET